MRRGILVVCSKNETNNYRLSYIYLAGFGAGACSGSHGMTGLKHAST